MKTYIRITRYPYEEPYHLNLVVAASNGRASGELEIYASASGLTRTAEALRAFPKSRNEVVWELGSELPSDRFAFYYRMSVSLLRPTGASVIGFRLNNNRTPPEKELSEFYLPAFPADLDRLAGLMDEFARLKYRFLEWTPEGGSLSDPE